MNVPAQIFVFFQGTIGLLLFAIFIPSILRWLEKP